MIGSLVGAGLKAVGSIVGGISASKAAKKAKGIVEQQQRENQDWYNKRYNEDATQRADAQRILTRTEEAIKNRNREIAGRSAVMGGDDARVAQEKALNAQAMADATSNIVVLGEARKDNIEQQYLKTNSSLNSQLANIELKKANAIADATKGMVGVAGDIQNALNTEE